MDIVTALCLAWALLGAGIIGFSLGKMKGIALGYQKGIEAAKPKRGMGGRFTKGE